MIVSLALKEFIYILVKVIFCTDREDDGYQFFPFFAHCYIAFQFPLTFDIQLKAVAASKGYHMVTAIIIWVYDCTEWLVTGGKYREMCCRGKCNTSWGDVEGVNPCDFLLSYSSTVVITGFKQ